jgi:hypothetical protein
MTEDTALDMVLTKRVYWTDYVGGEPAWRVRVGEQLDAFGFYTYRDATPEEHEVLERAAKTTGMRFAHGGGGAHQGPGEWLGQSPYREDLAVE